MKSTIVLASALALAACTLLLGDRLAGTLEHSPWELKAVLPTEVSPGRYVQVSNSELERMGATGWELVSVMPYVILNEERGPAGRKVAVTQAYPGYFFQRPRLSR